MNNLSNNQVTDSIAEQMEELKEQYHQKIEEAKLIKAELARLARINYNDDEEDRAIRYELWMAFVEIKQEAKDIKAEAISLSGNCN